MKRQSGQSALEFALMAPLILLIVFGAIYGGAMFIQFMNYSNDARAIAREISVASTTPEDGEAKSEREQLLEKYNNPALNELAVYKVSVTTVLLKADGSITTSDADAKEVMVRFDFDHGNDFPFGFPPRSFATTYSMHLEKN